MINDDVIRYRSSVRAKGVRHLARSSAQQLSSGRRLFPRCGMSGKKKKEGNPVIFLITSSNVGS
jgi:hypothetical protein